MVQRGTIGDGATAGSRGGTLVRLAAVFVLAGGLAACGTISEKMGGVLSDAPGIGLPEGVPERPAEAMAFPAVHDMPPPRSSAVLSEVEQQKMESDLLAAREAQQTAVADPDLPPEKSEKKPAKPSPRAVPASSSRTIY